MIGTANTRWLVSFADLLMLLLAFFVVLGASHADPARLGAGMRAAFGGAPVAAPATTPTPVPLDPATMFEPDDAVLRAGRASYLAAIGARFGTSRIVIVSTGEGDASGRLDRFELAAARTAAIGRALGIAPDRIAIEMRAGPGRAQRVTVSAR